MRSMFESYGSVDRVNIVTDRETGQARGFAFVEMSLDAEGNAAINGLNGKELDGRTLNVNEARPKVERGSGGNGPPHSVDLVDDIDGGAELLDVAGAEHNDAVRDRQGFFLVVGYEHGGDAEIALDRTDFLAQRNADLGIECRKRLIESSFPP